MARIILAAVHRPCTAARSIYWALRENGHEVVTVGPVERSMGWGAEQRYEAYEWQPHVELVPSPHDAQQSQPRFDERLFDKPVDLVLQLDRLIGGMGMPCPNVLWALDNHYGVYGYAEEFSHIFIGHSWGYLSDNPKAKWLPAGYDPRYHFIVDPQAERPIDVLLIGNPYPHRVEFVRQLYERGINGTFLSGLVWNDYNHLYNQAKIALVVSKNGDLSGRVFEHLAAGCLVVADKIPDMWKAGLKDCDSARHYLQYEDIADCAELIKEMLGGLPTAWQRIAADGHIAGAKHTWDARVDELLRTIYA